MGYRIKELRKLKGWTQDQLAKASNVSRQIISALENDSNTITTTKTLNKIANALGTTVDALFLASL